VNAAALRAQQLGLVAAVVDGAPAAGLFAAAPGGGAPRLDAYRHAYPARLAAALRDNHDILARALGDAAFDALAKAYIAAIPPCRPSIRWYGDRLAEVMGDACDAGNGVVPHPALVDLARMDAALRDAFDAADAAPLPASALAAVPPARWPALRLRLHPSVRRVALHWAVEPAWQALRDAGVAEPRVPEPQPLAHTLLVWRQGLDTRWRSLPAIEAGALQDLADGRSLGELGERVAAAIGDADTAAPQVATLLQQWLADGLIAGLRRR